MEIHSATRVNVRTYASRVSRIESQLRLWKVLFALPILALIILFCGGSKFLEDIPRLVKAQTGFMVSDKEGRTRIFLGVDDDGEWGLHFMDENGAKRLALGSNDVLWKERQKSWGLVVLDKQNGWSFQVCSGGPVQRFAFLRGRRGAAVRWSKP